MEIAKRTQKAIGIFGKQLALRSFSLPVPRHAERGEKRPDSIRFARRRAVSVQYFRPVPLPVRRIALSSRPVAKSNRHPEKRGGKSKQKAKAESG